MNNDRLQEIYNDAGRPGAQAFRFAVRRAGLQISDTEAKAFVAKQSTGQIFQGRIPSDGKIPGGGREDMRFQMDLIDWSKRIKKTKWRTSLRIASRRQLQQTGLHPTYAFKDGPSHPGSISKNHTR